VSADRQALWNRLRDDNFLVVGFTERTGFSVAALLEAHGLRYRISEIRPRDELRPLLARLRIADHDVLCGPQTPDQLAGITRIVLSPGVPRTIPLVVEAERRGIPVLGDIDFLYPFLRHKTLVGITGTDGKTTTASLTAEILAAGGSTVLAGNVGVPVAARLDEILACDFVVLELSSFMLERLHQFRPTFSTILNIAQDHVDRYASFAEYVEAKRNIVRHCTADDLFVCNLDDPVVAAAVPAHLRVRTFSASGRRADYGYADGTFSFRGHPLRYSDCLLRGVHNVENILAAAAIACEAGLDPEVVAAAVKRFRPLPHRFEHVGRFGGVDVYDDSKATTVHAVEAALRSLAGNVVLIVGGREKNLDVSPLRSHEAKIKLLMCYGEAGPRIQGTVRHPRSENVFRFEEAVERALDACAPGDVLLLSPACTSWDQFSSYEVRGAVFQKIVRKCHE